MLLQMGWEPAFPRPARQQLLAAVCFVSGMEPIWRATRSFNPNLLLCLTAWHTWAVQLHFHWSAALPEWLQGDRLEGKWLNCPHSHCWNANSPPPLASTERSLILRQSSDPAFWWPPWLILSTSLTSLCVFIRADITSLYFSPFHLSCERMS